MTRLLCWTLGMVLLTQAPQAWAQAGDRKDKKGQEQKLLIPKEIIPPAPHLSPQEALKTFTLPDGYRMELVAHEPMVQVPVALTFGPDGRMWVVEMRGFMPNADGKGERDIPGRIVSLEDTNGDGRMDKRTVFLDDLKMPRAVALAGDGVVVAEPPYLWFCKDTDGDGKADQKTAITKDYGSEKNPEHTANGMVWALDNWYYNLYHTYRYRYRAATDKWERQPIPNRVQWGLAQDNFGRRFFTSNSDQLRGDLYPSHYVGNTPGVKVAGLNLRVATDQTVWPGRVNAGVNRGYRKGTLRPDGTLARFTAACGTTIYRGDLLGKEFVNNPFVCEPSGNLIRRNLLKESDGLASAANAHGKGEFLTSTDERFRPVNLYTGPDGALYIADMYHGILQHRIYLTTYLRRQIEERGLDRPLYQGRIYRAVPTGRAVPPAVKLSDKTDAQLVGMLSHGNGWVRDTAQRLLVEKGNTDVVNPLRGLVASHPQSVTRLHALWTLEGLGKLDHGTVMTALRDKDRHVRAAGLRASESLLKIFTKSKKIVQLRETVLALAGDAEASVQMQLAFTLGAIAFDPTVKETLLAMKNKSKNKGLQSMAAFSLSLREPKKKTTQTQVAKGRPLTEAEKKQFELGRGIYEATCIACHQGHGLGQEGLAPPLAGSEWINHSADRLARIVLQGLRGPIKVKGVEYEIDMPSLAVLDDEQIAAVLTYIRREWGHSYEPITVQDVARVRKKTANREDAWTAAELEKIP